MTEFTICHAQQLTWCIAELLKVYFDSLRTSLVFEECRGADGTLLDADRALRMSNEPVRDSEWRRKRSVANEASIALAWTRNSLIVPATIWNTAVAVRSGVSGARPLCNKLRNMPMISMLHVSHSRWLTASRDGQEYWRIDPWFKLSYFSAWSDPNDSHMFATCSKWVIRNYSHKTEYWLDWGEILSHERRRENTWRIYLYIDDFRFLCTSVFHQNHYC